MLHKINYIDHMKTSTIVLDQAKPTAFLSACPVYKPTPLYKELIHDKPIWIKDEGQRMRLGAFKALGGVYAVAQLIAQKTEMDLDVNKFLSDEVKHIAKKMTFVCASAGNHAQGVAYSCNLLQIKGVIYMPKTTPKQKIKQVQQFGKKYVEIILTGDTFDDAFSTAIAACEKDKSIFIHPFDDLKVIAGQGTVGLEILESAKKPIDYLFVPIGGGGLAAGLSTVFKQLNHNTKIIGVEPEGAPSMKTSIANNKNTVKVFFIILYWIIIAIRKKKKK